MSGIVAVSNAGAEVTSTTYWQTPNAAAGYLYLSGNAHALRFLVPDNARDLVQQIPVGVPVELEVRIGSGFLSFFFLDDPATPFAVEIMAVQSDRRYPRVGETVPLLWYAPGDGEGVVEIRRETVKRVR